MAELQISRTFAADPDTVFRAVSDPAFLCQWWGHEGMTLAADPLDFTRLGPWSTTLTGSEGSRYKMSGQVTHVTPGQSVGFTWAWHDDSDARGAESHVTFTVEPDGKGGTIFTLSHVDLPSDDAAASHERGWGAILARLATLLST